MVHVNIRHIAAAKFVVLVLGAAHVLGCLWFLLARWARFSAAPDDETWLAQFSAATGIEFGCSGGTSAACNPICCLLPQQHGYHVNLPGF